ERIPAHVGDLEIGVVRRNARDIAFDPTQTVRHLVLASALRHELHADAYAEKGPPAPAHAVIERLHHTVNRGQAAPAIPKGSAPGEHDAVGTSDLIGIAGHGDLGGKAGLASGALEGFGGRMQITGPVVDNGDVHRAPPGSGNKPTISDPETVAP